MTFTRAYIRFIYRSALIFLICCCHAAMAQNADSLRGIAYERLLEDTTKVRLYAMASYAYRFSNPDSMVSTAGKGLALAEKLHFDKGKATCLVNLGLASLIKYELDKGIKYCNSGIAIYEQAKDSMSMEPAFYYLAALYYNQTRYITAIQYYDLCVRFNEIAGAYDRLALVYNNIGNCYSSMSNYPEALKYFLKGLAVNEKHGDKASMSANLSSIGQVYADMSNYKKAIDYIKQSLAIKDKAIDLSTIIGNYENAGGVYMLTGDYKSSLAAFAEALRLADSAKLDGSEIDRILCNQGEVYLQAGDYSNAARVYQRCLDDPQISINPALEGMANKGIGTVEIANGKSDDGIKHLLKALKIFQANNLKRQIVETTENLKDAYEKIKDYPHALAYTKMHYMYRDSLYNEKNDLKVQQLQFDYELQKKQGQIELLKQHRAANKIKLWALAFGLLLLSVIIVLLYRSRLREMRAREMISRQAASLDELNKFKDKVFSVLSHDLSGPINVLSATMTMLEDNTISAEEFNELKPEVNKQLNSITFLLDNLLKWSKSHIMAGDSVKPEVINLRQLAEQNINLSDASARRKKITINNNIPEQMTATADIGQMDIVIRNLLSNAIKFTPPEGKITLDAKQDAGTVKLSITDTGVGMDAQRLNKLFTTATDNSTYGTAGEKGIGLGLLLCYEFAKANNGNITVSSTVGAGSTFTLELPK